LTLICRPVRFVSDHQGRIDDGHRVAGTPATSEPHRGWAAARCRSSWARANSAARPPPHSGSAMDRSRRRHPARLRLELGTPR